MRAHLYQVVTNSDGTVQTNAVVRVIAPGSDPAAPVLLADPVYKTSDGPDTLGSTFTVANGVIDVWLDRPQFVMLGLTPPGGVEFFIDYVLVGAPTVTTVSTDDGSSLVIPGSISAASRDGQALLWDGPSSQPKWGAVAAGGGGGGLLSTATVAIDFTGGGDDARIDSPNPGPVYSTWYVSERWDSDGDTGWLGALGGTGIPLDYGVYSYYALCAGQFTGSTIPSWVSLSDSHYYPTLDKPRFPGGVDTSGFTQVQRTGGPRETGVLYVGPTWDNNAADPGFTGRLMVMIARWAKTIAPASS